MFIASARGREACEEKVLTFFFLEDIVKIVEIAGAY